MTVDRASVTADIVIPCFNESEALPLTVPRVLAYLRELQAAPHTSLAAFRIILVDDGSRDATWAVISMLHAAHPEIEGVRLSRNFGHQKALIAGLSHADADVVISIDADLQDDVAAIAAMLDAHRAGSDIVLGVRNDRSADTAFKRSTAAAFYRLLGYLGLTIVPNHADFRLMSARALEALLSHGEVNLFLRGLVTSIGFPVTLVPYKRHRRVAGTTKYPLSKMLSFAIDGLTSFSSTPLRLIAILGLVIFAIAMLLSLYVLALRVFFPADVIPGWASTLLPVLLLGGAQILSSGVLGEYIGKIYLEVKRRPLYFVDERLAAPCTRRPDDPAATEPGEPI